MFAFDGSPVPVREDLKEAHLAIWTHVSRPGPTMDAEQRIELLANARGRARPAGRGPEGESTVGILATTLYDDPTSVDAELVDACISEYGEARTVEAVSIVSMLSAVDGTHRALNIGPEPLPAPTGGEPTLRIATHLRRRRTHVAMPRNSITVALGLLPTENDAYAASCGPHYMTFEEMVDPIFGRSPGLDRAQLETIASRTSLLNECFY